MKRPALVLIGAVLAGCGVGEAGMELARQQPGETYPGERVELSGVLDVADNGCLGIVIDSDVYFVIWPAGSEDAELGDARGVRLPGGDAVGPGDTVAGVGAFTPTAPLVANRDGYWAHAIGYCAPDASEAVVFDSALRQE